MIFIGIDPGKSGGIAALTAGGHVLDYTKMPTTDRDILDALRKLKACEGVEGPARAMLELVRSSPQMGVVSAWTFGGSYFGLKMALTAVEIPYDEVVPRQWQRVMQCVAFEGDKNITKARAQQLFPNVKCTHAVADALLLAEYCRRAHS